MTNDVYSSMDSVMDMFAAYGTVALVSTIVAVVLNLALIVLMIASWWTVYDKMGEKGWKCLIPFYGRYTLFSCVWEGKIYFISLALRAVSIVMSLYGAIVIAWQVMASMVDMFSAMFGAETMTAVSAILPATGGAGVLLFAGIFSLAWGVVNLILNWRMVKCFGYGIGFFLGITFFPVIFVPVLAFGNAYFDYY